MADHAPAGAPEIGAEMDYGEHERTYSMFVRLAKWSIVLTVFLLVSMAVGFFSAGGLVGGALLFAVLTAGAVYLM